MFLDVKGKKNHILYSTISASQKPITQQYKMSLSTYEDSDTTYLKQFLYSNNC